MDATPRSASSAIATPAGSTATSPAAEPRRSPLDSKRLLLCGAIRRVRHDLQGAIDEPSAQRYRRELSLLLQSRAQLDTPRDPALVRYWVYAPANEPADLPPEGRVSRLVMLDHTATPARERLFLVDDVETWLPLDGELHPESGEIVPAGRDSYVLTPAGHMAATMPAAPETPVRRAPLADDATDADVAHATAVDRGAC
ncbi:hypothetical protein [Roseisolibacter agri]|uniref:Uncharacterized protein n=1 Tax=Roseisolibacter agri TaxID=2014610 RepID=A0AA37Q5I9_9BACT|nr:hypothetical protein [Roseisolibacter agri]GLC25042.1 hypothetical protein rosag_15550 [Roseisolibacter agri]